MIQRSRRMLALFPLVLVMTSTSACMSTTSLNGPATGGPKNCSPSLSSLESKAGKAWYEAVGWRYATRDSAEIAYRSLIKSDPSPWPDWYSPQETVLQPGTRFQMAIGGGQTPETPGGYGTFENVKTVKDVRNSLAVRRDWKPEIDRVVTYEVIRPLPAKVGPIGPQIDPQSCKFLIGRWSQFEMSVPKTERIHYLKVINIRPIR